MKSIDYHNLMKSIDCYYLRWKNTMLVNKVFHAAISVILMEPNRAGICEVDS
jgi:hypothetical protein